jgi:hypothetical protein
VPIRLNLEKLEADNEADNKEASALVPSSAFFCSKTLRSSAILRHLQKSA